MGNVKLKVQSEDLRKQATELRKSKNNHQAVRKKIVNLVTQIALDWQGDAADAHLASDAILYIDHRL